MSSRTSDTAPVPGSNTAAAWIDPVSSNNSWRARASDDARTSAPNSAGTGGLVRGSSRDIRLSIDAVPQIPHDDVVRCRRASGVGATPPVDTVTTLYAVSLAEPVAQYRTVRTGAPARSPSVWQNP